MVRGLLPEHIGPLVDRLRSGDHQAISLPDVAALTEVLMRSLESYFKSIDLTIYEECQSLADYIDDARQEISSLSPDQNNEVGIPRAGLELEAIVQQTESATNTIMGSAERIMEADPNDMETYAETVNDAVMQIFEACSFQDITGQRISKVVSTLEHVEDRVGRLINILGVMEVNKKKDSTSGPDIDEDKALLNGPALDGEGIDQSEIDALLNGDSAGFDSVVTDDTAIDHIEKDGVINQEGNPPEISKKSNSISNADDIDFMFDGQADMGQEEPAPEATTPEKTTPEKTPTMPEPVAPAEGAVVTEPEGAVTEPEAAVTEPEAAVTEPVAPDAPEPLNLIEQAKEKKAAASAIKKAQKIKPAPVVYEEGPNAALNPKKNGNTSQEDIDALFS